ncbi:hypothetical protein KVR01_007151 [Diaporthe batatas]|uniref:uncharacterized protein n=1 Tax=Diaporthe batatas TaxID=748121 RepID=UPI001D05B18E|nr:uncharacterized protein KVR01_007151 [Diaporthe batatas]KAG8162673.1 hypothetical protein KVR01_007151 [Diaporthe batatas]
MSHGATNAPNRAHTDAAAPGPSGGYPVADSNGSDSTVRSKKTVGFIGFGETAGAVLKAFVPVANRVINDRRTWATTVCLAREQSATTSSSGPPSPIRGDHWPTSIEPPDSLNFACEETLQVALQSDLIILDCATENVLPTLRGRGMAIALTGKVVVSLVPGVTIAEMYDALYAGENSPAPLEDSEQCFITRARPIFAPTDGDHGADSATVTLLVPPTDRVPRPRESQIQLADVFFSGFGTIRKVEESQIDVQF